MLANLAKYVVILALTFLGMSYELNYSIYLPVISQPRNNCGIEVWPGNPTEFVKETGCIYVRYTPGTGERWGLYTTWIKANRDWSALNDTVTDINRIKALGMIPVVVFFGNEQGTCQPPDNYTLYANFIREFSERYEITYVELWNEADYVLGHPHLYGCWGVDKRNDYLTFVETALSKLPDEIIVGVSFSFANYQSIPMISTMKGTELDFVAFHYYETYGYSSNRLAEKIDQISKATALPVWVTELNLLSQDKLKCESYSTEFENEQAQFVGESMEIGKMLDIPIFVYALTTYQSSWRCAALLVDRNVVNLAYKEISER